MAVISDIEIRLRADIARLQQDMNGARRSVDGAMGGITRAVNAARSAFIGLAAGIGLSELGRLTDQYTKFTAQLKLATNSQREYAQAVDDVKRISTSAQNDIGATGVLYARIIASTRELGVAQSKVAKVTETVNLALASTGAGTNEAASAMLQLSQAFGSGVLRGEEFNAVYEAAPELLRILARDMDVPIGKLRKLAEAGALTSDRLVKAFSNDEVIEGLRENVKQITTISGAFTVFKNNLIEIIGTQAHASGAVKLITTAILGAADAVRILAGVLGPALKIGAAYIATFVAAPAIFQFTATAIGRLQVQIALAKLEMASGASVASLFAGSIGGVGIAAQWASGMLGKLAIFSSLVFAAFVGWEIGKYLESQFVEVEIAAEVMTGELLKAWQTIKFGFTDAFDALTIFGRRAIEKIVYGLTAVHKGIAAVARAMGQDVKANQIDAYAESLREATSVDSTYTARSAERRAEMEKQIKLIDMDTDRRSSNALMRRQLIDVSGRESLVTAAAALAQTAATKEQIAQAKKLAEAYADLMQKLNERVDATARELAGIAPLTEAEKEHLDLTDQIIKKKLVLSKVQEAAARSLIDEAGANDVLIKSNKEWNDLQQKLADNAADLARDRAGLIESARQEAEQNELLVETFGMADAAIIRLNASRLIEQETQRLGRQLTEEEITDLQRVIELKERSAAAVASRAELESVKQFWTDIDKTAHDTFVSIADGGKNAFQRLKDTAKNVFFDWLYQQTLKKWIINIGTASAGTAGVSGIANAAGGAGGLGEAFSLAGSANSLYGSITGGATLAGGLGTGFLGSLAGGLNGAGMGSGLTSALGMNIGNSIAGVVGPNVASGIASGLSGLAAAAPWVAGALAVYTIGKKAFGRGPKEMTGNSTLTGSLGAGGFSGNFQDEWKKKGGWFSSSKTGFDSRAVETEVAASLGGAYDAIKSTSADFARVLGINADNIANRTQSIKIAMGKDEAANQQAIADFFTGVANTVAGELLPEIGRFQMAGEEASTTLQRLATNYAALDQILAAVGINAQDAFRAVGVASIEARERLISFAGGIEALATQTQFFNQNFLSQAEQIAIISGPLNKELERLGYAGITSADQFKQAVQEIVSSGRLATEEGARTYAGLLAIGPQFKTVADYLKELSDAAAEAAKNAKAAADAIAAQALADNETLLRAAVDSAFDAVRQAVDSQRAQVTSAFEGVMSSIGASLDMLNGKASELTRLSDALRSGRGSVASDAQQMASRSSARAQVQAAIAIAKASGVLPTADSLKDALSALNADSADQFSSLADYQREVARSNLELDTLGGLTERQLTDTQRQIRLLEDQKVMAQLQYDNEMLRLDGILEWAQAEVDAINGVDRSVQSVVAAIAGLKVASAALQQGATTANPNGSNLSVEDLYRSVLGREGEAAGVDYWKNVFGAVVDADEYKAFIQGAQPELEMIDRQNRQAAAAGNMSGTMSSSAESKNTGEIADMKSSMARTAAAVEQLASQFSQVSGGGNMLLTEAG